MINRIFFPVLLVSSLAFSSAQAQSCDADCCPEKCLARHKDIRKFYVAGALDGAIFSTATIHHDAIVYDPSGSNLPATDRMGTMRFTWLVNFGATFNWNLSGHLGIYTGLDVKNIGYIEQDNGYTLKRRSYNIGAPLGIKIGNMKANGSYFILGGGIDVPFNYNEKYYKDRDNKTRINEWFSDRTPGLMPYVFAGGTFNHHITVKVQYYPTNFLNPDFKDDKGMMPNKGTEVHLILLSVGFGMHVSFHNHHHKEYSGNNPPPSGAN